jgi:putative membrane protein
MNLLTNIRSDKTKLQRICIAVIVVNHLIGLAGLNIDATRETFEYISWLNLLITYLLILLNDDTPNKKLLYFTLAVFALGMCVEIAGVNYGYIFGSYHYTPTLGIAMLGVPLIIGINWALLTYAAGVAANKASNNIWLRIITGASIMVGLDVLLEFFALHHNLWIWPGLEYPSMQNFIGWFITALPAQFIFQKLLPERRNLVAFMYVFVLLAFTVADLLLSRL